jgi:hypothetical protein
MTLLVLGVAVCPQSVSTYTGKSLNTNGKNRPVSPKLLFPLQTRTTHTPKVEIARFLSGWPQYYIMQPPDAGSTHCG